MNKNTLAKYIKGNSTFHRFVNLSAHSLDQLKAIKNKIDADLNPKNTAGLREDSNSSNGMK
jgi:hypothetical protein